MPVSLMSLADGRDLLIVFLPGSTCLFGSRKIKGLLWIGRKTPRVPIWVLQPEPHREWGSAGKRRCYNGCVGGTGRAPACVPLGKGGELWVGGERVSARSLQLTDLSSSSTWLLRKLQLAGG